MRVSWALLILRLVAQVLSWAGLAVIVVAAMGLVMVYIPLGMAEVRYAWSKSRLAAVVRDIEKESVKERQEGEDQTSLLMGKPVDTVNRPEWEVPDENYSIYIPKIFARSRVIPNVDAGDSKVYLAALKQGVAEAKGLAHPGERGTTYLFAHSVGSRVDFARYNAVFYLLDKLGPGDRVEIVYQGKLYRYEVESKEVLVANDTKYLVVQKTSERLVLQTCYPPGTTWKRLVVVAKRT